MPAEEWFIVSLLLTFQRAQVHHKEEDIVCLHCYRVTRHQPPALTRSSRLHLALCVNIKRLTLAWCLLLCKSGFLFKSLCIHIYLLSNIQKHFNIIFHHHISSMSVTMSYSADGCRTESVCHPSKRTLIIIHTDVTRSMSGPRTHAQLGDRVSLLCPDVGRSKELWAGPNMNMCPSHVISLLRPPAHASLLHKKCP